uniref:Putative conserved secreted protein n=1 Tax=Amblyomma tuberculatum TaxID=48802 RepID=A0A6M2E4S8_9ACAR
MDKSALALLLVAAVGVSSVSSDYTGRIKFDCAAGVDYAASIDAYLRRIPNNITLPSVMDTEIMGFKTSPPVLTGLGSLWTYKPYYTFCVDNQTFVEAVVFADEPLTLSIKWKICTGSRGKVGAKVSSSKVRLYFMAAPTVEEPTKVILYNLEPESLDDERLFVEGATSGFRTLVEVVNVVAMPNIERLWSLFLRTSVPRMLRVDLRI